MKPIIEVKGLSKKYRLGEIQPYFTLRDTLADIFKNPLGAVKAQLPLEKDEFWALKDINFEVNQGEVVGIIGRNGAGKSTLLKILSQITPPTEGEAILRGRVGSLLEVGTGFSPELTGRENIYLNGAILGMSKAEVKKKFDEIVDFSEIEKFLDSPLKHYSSGMYMRLAFAVAAHLEPEILIIDEVLAVGDTEFQKKALGKMNDVSKSGRTILFVSHNMSAIKDLCTKGILIEKGTITSSGSINAVAQSYLSDAEAAYNSSWSGSEGDETLVLEETWVKSLSDQITTDCDLEIGITINIKQNMRDLVLGYRLFSEFGYELIYSLFDDYHGNRQATYYPGRLTKKFIIPANTLAEGNYKIEFEVAQHSIKRIIKKQGELSFSMHQSENGKRFHTDGARGLTSIVRPNWPVE